MSRLLRKYKGKVCTFFQSEDEDLGWVGQLISWDKEYYLVKGDNQPFLIDRSAVTSIIEGDYTNVIELRVEKHDDWRPPEE